VPDVPILQVLLHDVPIGTLALLEGRQTLFAFNASYIEDPASRPSACHSRIPSAN